MKKLFALAFLFAVAAVGQAGTLFGLSSNFFGGTPGQLWSIDESTGAAGFIADVVGSGGAVNTSLVGLASLGGQLYACDVFDSTARFWTIDSATGVFTAISAQNGGASINWFTLAPDPVLNTIYTIEREASAPFSGHLLSVDPLNGNVTDIGLASLAGVAVSIDDLAYDTGNSTLYAVGEGNIYTMNAGTGALTLLAGGYGAFNNVADLTYDPFVDGLFLNDGANLYSVDAVSGANAFIGANGGSQTIDGLAPVPEPFTVVGLGGLLLATAARRRLRKSG